MTGSEALLGVATLFKRVKNITKGVRRAPASTRGDGAADGAGRAGAAGRALRARAPAIRDGRRRAATTARRSPAIAALQPAVAKFFDDVLVMAEDEQLRAARLALVATLRDLDPGYRGYFGNRDGVTT